MRVCAHARIWMSQGVRKERQRLCALLISLSPFSATPAYQIYAPVLLHSPGSPLPYLCFKEKGYTLATHGVSYGHRHSIGIV